jgi:hypothetical protein
MWIELWLVRQLGFHEWSLRLFPFVCSVASILLFRHVTREICQSLPCVRQHPCKLSTGGSQTGANGSGEASLAKVAELFSVAIFSVSYYPLRHGVEAKQYASDLLVSLTLFALALAWLKAPQRVGVLWLLAAATPVALGLSHPAVFVVGAIGLSVFASIWRCRTRRVWFAFLGLSTSILLSFGLLYFISTEPQFAAASDEGIMRSYWARSFPPVTQVTSFAVWFANIHLGQLFAYPAGGAHAGAGAVPFVLFVTGATVFLRTGDRLTLFLSLTPFTLNIVAAAMHRYPYGGYARISQHLAPTICLLAGVGAARVALWFQQARARRVQLAFAGGLAAFAAGLMVQDLVQPYRSEHDRRVREFARWFWQDNAIDAELVCALTDMRQTFFRHTYLWRGIAQYLCNQRIYSPNRRVAGKVPDWDAISADHPLRCVVFSRPGLSRDEAAFDKWFEDLRARFSWAGYEQNNFYKPHEHGPDIERIEVYEFVPKNHEAIGANHQRFEPLLRSTGQRAN